MNGLEITDVRIFLVDQKNNPKLKAFAIIVLNDCFLVRDIKIIEGRESLFISMPSKKGKDEKYLDTAHPLNQQSREFIAEKILTKYKVVANAK